MVDKPELSQNEKLDILRLQSLLLFLGWKIWLLHENALRKCQQNRRWPIPNLAKLMPITSAVKTPHVQSAFHLEVVGLWILVSFFQYFHCWWTIFHKLALNLKLIKVCWRLHTITNIWHLEATVDYFHEVAKCRLRPFG